MAVTAKDIAVAVGTSTASVSRAFRADKPMSDDLREVILKTAKELGYTPPHGRASRDRGKLSVSLVVGNILNPYYATVLDHFAQTAMDRNIELRLHIVPSNTAVDATMSQVFASRSDGVIVTSAYLNSEIARECQRRGFPVILFGRVQIDSRLTAVTGDNYFGGRLAGKRLIEKGRRRIAFLSGQRQVSTHLERRRGFLDMLDEAGIGLHGEYAGEFDYGLAHEVGLDLVSRSDRPDAIFCANDMMAFGVIDALRAHGLTPGEDLSVIGYDDIPMAAWPAYRLTTIRQRMRLMVQEALTTLTALIAEPSSHGSIKITPGYLVERDSG